VAHCQTRTEPIFWTEEMYSKDSYEIMEESRRFGLGHGFSIPVRESDKVVSMISLGRDQPFSAAELEVVLPMATVLASCLHVASQKIIVPTMITGRRPNLSTRELECLKWVAQGKSNTMIADILNVSDSTVAFHIKNSLKKLNVATRMQAVGVCVAMGMIG
jgi:DNA-binding CsgD family transcriptional regulator